MDRDNLAAEQPERDPVAVEQADQHCLDDQADDHVVAEHDHVVAEQGEHVAERAANTAAPGTSSTDNEVSDNEVFDQLADEQVNLSKKQAKKVKQKEKKKSEAERKRKNSTASTTSKILKTDGGGSRNPSHEEVRRRSLSGGFIPMVTDPLDQPQVTATPVNNKMLPKSPIFTHGAGTHTISPTNILQLNSTPNSRNKITKENRTGL